MIRCHSLTPRPDQSDPNEGPLDSADGPGGPHPVADEAMPDPHAAQAREKEQQAGE